MRLGLFVVAMTACWSITTRAAQDPPPVYAEKFTIEQQIDADRYVEKEVLTNTVEGDFILEFSARRNDGTSERWTVTYARNAALDHLQHVQVNGAPRYSINYAHGDEDPRITISVASLSAELTLLQGCGDADVTLFKALTVQTAADRTVVSAVLAAMPGGGEADPPANCHGDCLERWIFPECDPPPPGDWGKAIACCVAGRMFMYCLRMCECSRLPDPFATAECADSAYQQLLVDLETCIDGGIDGILAANCP
jgi:hypothetical protein